MTLVAFVQKILERDRSAHILLTAPSNTAADVICHRLIQFVIKHEIKMLRLNAAFRNPNTII